MCYNKRVGHEVRGTSREGKKKIGTPTRPNLKEIERIKASRLVGLEKQIVQVLVKLRARQLTLAQKIKEIESMPYIQRRSEKHLELVEDLRTEYVQLRRQIYTIQFTPRGETGTEARKRWLEKMKKAA